MVMEPLGLAADLAGVESVLRLFGGAIGLSAQGAPDGLAIALAAQDSKAEIIPGMTRKMIEDALTPAVQAMVRQHAGSLPGIDLGTALGIQPEIGPPPPPTTGASPTPGPAGSRPSSP
jgi:hypothetical protein